VSVSRAPARRCRWSSVGHVIQLQQRNTPPPTAIERDGDHDPAQPGDGRGRLIQIAEPPERAKVGVLRRVLGKSPISNDPKRDSERHLLRRLDQASVRLQAARPGTDHEVIQ
jgi:hypothetical protein